MKKPGARVTVIVLAGILLTLRPCAFALNPALDINQYAHKAWTAREGLTQGQITSIAQTADGYIWLGTEFGLLRFDGIKNVLWQPPADHQLPSRRIFSLLVSHDGTLWIGTTEGLASLKDGRITQYAQFAGRQIFALIEDRDGSVWATANAVTTGKLCAIRNASVQCDGDDGRLGRGAFNLFEDSKGNLWAGVKNGLWRWRPGPPKFYPLDGEPDGIQALGEDADGTLLVGWRSALYRFVDGKTEPYPLPKATRPFQAKRITRDDDGALWIATTTQGLLHVNEGRIDVFAQSEGLSGDSVHALFQDREGDIWAATINGLDRFHDFPITTLTQKQGLSTAVVTSVLSDREGSLWLSTRAGLDRKTDHRIEAYRFAAKPTVKPNELPNSLFQDSHGRIWVSTYKGLGYLDRHRFVPLSTLPGGIVLSMAQDRAGNLWVANERSGLFRLSPSYQIQATSWAELGRDDHASILAADPSQGGLWIGFFLGGIAYFEDGHIRRSYSAANGLGEGRVSGFLFDHDGTLWISTAGGLSRLKDGHLSTLTGKNGLPCDTVHWMMEDDDHSFWLYTPCGLIRINHSEVAAWVNDPNRTIQVTVFDSFDGVRSLASSGHYNPQVAKSTDGKLWFLPWDGVSVIDPHHLHFNKLPPPVHVEQIIANHKTYDATSRMRLPPLVRDLEIDYTALSLVAPEKVRFRYKLENWDRDWQDAGNRRQAFYGNLSPGNYRFRVTACNNSGVWNEAGTFLDFSVAPAYYQTLWFRLSCVFAFLALLAAAYRLRVRQLAGQFNLRLEERVNERTRIARDLHDTLLQSFQGLMLKFRVLAFLLPDRPAEAGKILEEVIEQARAAITEGRDAVQGLRSSMVATNDLAQAISTLGEQLNAEQTGQPSRDFRVHVEGAPREIVPLLRDDVYRIAGEALRNAFRHAHARQIEVDIRYDQSQFRLRIRDDGKGIAPRVLAGNGQLGHYGLHGMHERAKLIGGKLEVWSELDSGTEVELTIPASRAYAGSPAMRRFLFWRR